MNALRLAALLVLLLAHQIPAQAGVPLVHPVQGILIDGSGHPQEGTLDVIFTLYADGVAGNPVWTETQQLTLVRGLYAAYLGVHTPLPPTVFAQADGLWLEARVANGPPGERIALATHPYGQMAARAGAGGAPEGMIAIFDNGCPTGWSRLASLDGRLPRGAAQFGPIGGGAHTHGADSSPIAATQSGSHAHGLAAQGMTLGTAGSHSHSISMTSGLRDHSHTLNPSLAFSGPVQTHTHDITWSCNGGQGAATGNEREAHLHTFSTSFTVPNGNVSDQYGTLAGEDIAHDHTATQATFSSAQAAGHAHTLDVGRIEVDSAPGLPPYVEAVFCSKDPDPRASVEEELGRLDAEKRAMERQLDRLEHRLRSLGVLP